MPKVFNYEVTFSDEYSDIDVKEVLETFFDCLTFDCKGINVSIKDEGKYEKMWKRLYKKYDGDLCYLPDTMDDIEKEYIKKEGKKKND